MNSKKLTGERRAIIAGIAGNVMEWYDFSVYGYFAANIGRHFLEEVAPDIGCKIAVDAEIVPLHHVTGDTGDDGAPFPCQLFRVHPQTQQPCVRVGSVDKRRCAILPER